MSFDLFDNDLSSVGVTNLASIDERELHSDSADIIRQVLHDNEDAVVVSTTQKPLKEPMIDSGDLVSASADGDLDWYAVVGHLDTSIRIGHASPFNPLSPSCTSHPSVPTRGIRYSTSEKINTKISSAQYSFFRSASEPPQSGTTENVVAGPPGFCRDSDKTGSQTFRDSSAQRVGVTQPAKRSFSSVVAHEDDEEDDDSKIMRTGSLGRILASGNSVDDRMFDMMHPVVFQQQMDGSESYTEASVKSSYSSLQSNSSVSTLAPGLRSSVEVPCANTPSLDGISFTVVEPSGQTIKHPKSLNRKRVSKLQTTVTASTQPVPVAPFKASATFSKIIEAFNQCDLDSLSYLMRLCCHKNCELYSNALTSKQIIRGRRDVMIYWALQMETYPDGIWVCTKSNTKGMTITREFKFSGTRMFRRSTSELYDQVKLQEALMLDQTKGSYEIDEISYIMQGCWVSPVVVNKNSAVTAIDRVARPILIQRSNVEPLPMTVASEIKQESLSLQSQLRYPTPGASLKSASVMALAIREQGNVANIDRGLALTFNSGHYIVRIDTFGDL